MVEGERGGVIMFLPKTNTFWHIFYHHGNRYQSI